MAGGGEDTTTETQRHRKDISRAEQEKERYPQMAQMNTDRRRTQERKWRKAMSCA